MPIISGPSTTTGKTLRQVTTITASTTYTVPAGVNALYVECVGGGGQGGGTAATAGGQAAAGGGGGGGAYSAAWLTGLGASFVVTIGAGGSTSVAGNNVGQVGGDTSFGASVVAKGGAGGNGSPVLGAFPAIGGGAVLGGAAASGTGDVKESGGDGGPGICLSVTVTTDGRGGNAAGVGGGTAIANQPTGGGQAGKSFGGGGSGAIAGASQSAQQGGAGANGLVRVWEFRQG